MAELTMWDLFYWMWAFLDACFSNVELALRLMLPYLPPTSIPFLIGIICYSITAFLIWFINKTNDESIKRTVLKCFYIAFSIVMVLMFVWRMGIIALIPNEDTAANLSAIIISAFYLGFGAILIIAFLKKITWLKAAIIGFIWGLFLFDVFILAPITGEMLWNEGTLPSVAFIGLLFAVPHGHNLYVEWKKSGAD